MPISDRSHIIQTAFMLLPSSNGFAYDGICGFFFARRPPSALLRTSNNFLSPCLQVQSYFIWKKKKIIISECISATDRNNEFQLRVLLRDEMLLRSVFSAKDLIFYYVRKSAKKSLLNFWAQKFIICDCIF